jgi:hypothetical protein
VKKPRGSRNKKIWRFLLLLLMVLIAIPLVTAADHGIVPCHPKLAGKNLTGECTLEDLIITVIRLINFLIAGAGAVTAFYLLFAGFGFIIGQGNPEKVEQSKKAIVGALSGLGIVVLAFTMVNLAINGILCKGGSLPWNDPVRILKANYIENCK